jgi:transposase-like protein
MGGEKGNEKKGGNEMDKNYDFLNKIGFIDQNEKWACKNCLFEFVLEYLSSEGSDQ